MYEYSFKNDPALSAAINDLDAWRFACLLTKKPDKRTVLDEVKHGDLVRIRYALYDVVSTLLGGTPLARGLTQSYSCECERGQQNAHLGRDGYLLLSLRDRQGQPHMTIELDGGIALQARGKANSVPKDRYIDEARRLLAKRGLRSLDDIPAASIGGDELQVAA